MGVAISDKEYSRAKVLEKLGIPLDNELLEKSRSVLSGLDIDQDPNIPATTIFDTIHQGTGVQITLSILNNTSRTILLSRARLDIPWCNMLTWLEDPLRRAPAKEYYTLPMPDSPRLERDVVINHRIRHKSKLYPGDRLEGSLVGAAPESIPENYKNRGLFKARFSIFDSRNNLYAQDLKFLICRIPKKEVDIYRYPYRHRRRAMGLNLQREEVGASTPTTIKSS